ncbi:RNA 2',3'-cyclic phosphodiesterase [Streptomyces sp. ME19-01-6]|uniref:RNA 2',3'-cyclic phosphodiesterase n=1 Tax=Streptomyces sp. ME19-01-6 TaxID=3028686 RepID=UPI0029B9BEC2|nr:RNA 2',3'-cyclic phosphodiesterase [Streptomyces sp. ME19-01-6]MDX3227327.1 RNA 2',3'-cyclic phosphodiesterase [Streptomyces sp. ME19-01-6]
MRLFAAVLPPEAAIAELAARVGALRGLPGADGLRWTERAGWHFTLAFFGQVDEEVLPALRERLARAAHRHPPHEVRLAGGGRFSDKVVWVGVEGDRATLGHLADSAEAGARRAGLPMDRHRPYHPHLTLARCRGGADLRPYVAGLADFEGSAWTVAELSLVRSHPPTPGVAGAQPRYEVVAAWPLGH